MKSYNFLFEKYKNLNSEENFVNDYAYRNIEKLKSKPNLSIKLRKPKFYEKNKHIENFESLKLGSEKVLHEFQNLFIHKFLINENKKQKDMKKSFNTFDAKQKVRPNFQIFNDNKIINKMEKEDAYKSLIKIIKNCDNKEDKLRRPQSRPQSRIIRLFPQNSSKSLRKTLFNLSEKNKYLTYQYLKQGEKFLAKSVESIQKKPIKLFQEKSKLSLLKQISSKIIQDKIAQALKFPVKIKNDSSSNFRIKKRERIKSCLKLEENKNSLDAYINNNNISSRNKRYIELSKNCCNLSDAIVIHKKYYFNSIINEKKLTKKIRPKNINLSKRPMTTLEKYYLRYGAI